MNEYIRINTYSTFCVHKGFLNHFSQVPHLYLHHWHYRTDRCVWSTLCQNIYLITHRQICLVHSLSEYLPRDSQTDVSGPFAIRISTSSLTDICVWSILSEYLPHHWQTDVSGPFSVIRISTSSLTNRCVWYILCQSPATHYSCHNIMYSWDW